MKYFFSVTLFSWCMFTAMAQHQLAGIVKDKADGSPVPFATAVLLRPDSSAITGVMTGDDGKFVINNVATGDYLLQVSFIGYERFYRNVNVPSQSDLGDILLSESATRMQEVVVTANADRNAKTNGAAESGNRIVKTVPNAERVVEKILRAENGVHSTM